jgi:hypothetical protein
MDWTCSYDVETRTAHKSMVGEPLEKRPSERQRWEDNIQIR